MDEKLAIILELTKKLEQEVNSISSDNREIQYCIREILNKTIPTLKAFVYKTQNITPAEERNGLEELARYEACSMYFEKN